MKKEKPTLCERCFQKNFAETTRNSAETAQSLYNKEEHTLVGRSFASTAKNPTRQKTKKYVKNI